MNPDVCLYHRDLDGECSAAIVNKKLKGEGIAFIDIDYREDPPKDLLRESDRVIIVDFSIDPDLCIALMDAGTKVVWIDHHQSAIDKYMDFPFTIKGIRTEDDAACVLTWRYFFPDEEPPISVKLIGDRDTWMWEWGELTKKFTAGMDARNTFPLNEELWGDLLLQDSNLYGDIVQEGATIVRYRETYWKEYREAWAFERTINGHSMLCMNLARSGSEAFGRAGGEHDILCAFGYNGSSWTFSWYSENWDVRKLAEHFGGGGHPGAAGAVLEEFPFQEEETEIDCEITRQ